jgi:hypothetical protein
MEEPSSSCNPQFKVNECKNHVRSSLDTVTLSLCPSKIDRVKFLVDTGADISIIKESSLKPECDFKIDKSVEIKGISNGVVKTRDTISLKLFSDHHETVHDFHVVGEEFILHYDGILGRDFWENKKAVIDYCKGEILMEDVIIKFDSKDTDNSAKKTLTVTLKARSENIVRLPTSSLGQGWTSRKEILPGIFLAESITKGINGTCITSMINTLESEVTIDALQVDLEKLDELIKAEAMIFATTLIEDENRLSKLRKQLRTEHLNGEERISLIRICEEYNDVFLLPGVNRRILPPLNTRFPRQV